jgi:hypothetical protein
MPDVELSAGTIEYQDTGGDGPVRSFEGCPSSGVRSVMAAAPPTWSTWPGHPVVLEGEQQ